MPLKLKGMTTKEHLHKLVDELSDAEVAATLEFVTSRGGHGELEGEPEMLPLPTAWQLLPSGQQAPNWVAGLDEVRRAKPEFRPTRDTQNLVPKLVPKRAFLGRSEQT